MKIYIIEDDEAVISMLEDNLLYTLIPMHEVMATYYERQLTALDRTTERHKAQIKLSAQQGA